MKEIKILNSQTLAIKLEAHIFNKLIAKTLENFQNLLAASKALSQLDIFCGWAELSRDYHHYCPEIVGVDCLEIVNGWHLIIEQMLTHKGPHNFGNISNFIPNDLKLKNKCVQIATITAPKIASKSAYIRQIALIAILAHIGCWVPPENLRFPSLKKFFGALEPATTCRVDHRRSC
jgi:DNA mismatch repair protein MutS